MQAKPTKKRETVKGLVKIAMPEETYCWGSSRKNCARFLLTSGIRSCRGIVISDMKKETTSVLGHYLDIDRKRLDILLGLLRKEAGNLNTEDLSAKIIQGDGWKVLGKEEIVKDYFDSKGISCTEIEHKADTVLVDCEAEEMILLTGDMILQEGSNSKTFEWANNAIAEESEVLRGEREKRRKRITKDLLRISHTFHEYVRRERTTKHPVKIPREFYKYAEKHGQIYDL